MNVDLSCLGELADAFLFDDDAQIREVTYREESGELGYHLGLWHSSCGPWHTGRLLYFAYGSNMDLEELRSSCPGAELRYARARLDGYEFDFRRFSQRRQGGAADIVRRANANLFGCVWDIPVAERAALDSREGSRTHTVR